MNYESKDLIALARNILPEYMPRGAQSERARQTSGSTSGSVPPQRRSGGRRALHHRAARASWRRCCLPGWNCTLAATEFGVEIGAGNYPRLRSLIRVEASTTEFMAFADKLRKEAELNGIPFEYKENRLLLTGLSDGPEPPKLAIAAVDLVRGLLREWEVEQKPRGTIIMQLGRFAGDLLHTDMSVRQIVAKCIQQRAVAFREYFEEALNGPGGVGELQSTGVRLIRSGVESPGVVQYSCALPDVAHYAKEAAKLAPKPPALGRIVLAPRRTLADLQEIDTTSLPDGTTCLADGVLYMLSKTARHDGRGDWYRMTSPPPPERLERRSRAVCSHCISCGRLWVPQLFGPGVGEACPFCGLALTEAPAAAWNDVRGRVQQGETVSIKDDVVSPEADTGNVSSPAHDLARALLPEWTAEVKGDLLTLSYDALSICVSRHAGLLEVATNCIAARAHAMKWLVRKLLPGWKETLTHTRVWINGPDGKHGGSIAYDMPLADVPAQLAALQARVRRGREILMDHTADLDRRIDDANPDPDHGAWLTPCDDDVD